ncbi:trehalase-like [Schistocerca piceifrons]|uniref:trehalase-like n=1 Tax=Schistocerca piceifrons TaxID=274613 RepID=UPI001F5F211E|nr:trehalase-like [Schistocerca piceifrons]
MAARRRPCAGPLLPLPLLLLLLLGAAAGQEVPPSCDSQIYCQGSLLDTVQKSKIYSDDKTFVDMKQKKPSQEILSEFQTLMDSTNGSPSQEQIRNFVSDNFEEGKELEEWTPPDWVKNPSSLNTIRDPDLRNWAYYLNDMWKELARRISDDVKENPDRYSLIYVPNGFIIPGGRFREYYYWDTYWIVNGILICGMKETAKGIIANFAHMVEDIGHIPNGGRVYYLERSQPPMFVPMIYSYTTYVKPHEAQMIIKQYIDTMDKEFSFWMSNRTVAVEKNGKSYTLCRYYAPSSGPRPESYTDDIETAQYASTNEARENIYHQIKSGAESGWDFSGRWFIKDKTNAGNLSNIQTQYIIPVDLNAFVYWNAEILCKFHSILHNHKKAQYYCTKAKEWLDAVTEVFWHDDVGIWLDYDISNNVRREYFYPSNVAPLWTGCYKKERISIDKIIAYLKDNKIDRYPGGVPTSLDYTGEQWDYPNAWPPLQGIIIQGLDLTEYPRAQKYAYELAQTWVQSNYKSYKTDGYMYEKYDASSFGRKGGGGEYEVQTGFGWSNGIILELLKKYGQVLVATPKTNNHESRRAVKRRKQQRGKI